MSDSNSENNNSQGFEWIWGDVYELGKVSEMMTSDT